MNSLLIKLTCRDCGDEYEVGRAAAINYPYCGGFVCAQSQPVQSTQTTTGKCTGSSGGLHSWTYDTVAKDLKCNNCNQLLTTVTRTKAGVTPNVVNSWVSQAADEGDPSAMPRPPASCNHEWVWSGVPKGGMWCKLCDVDYNEKLHGSVPDQGGKYN